MRVLVTGGAGFIGSHLADRLLDDGHQVLILDNLSTGQRRNIPDGAHFLEGDVEDTNRLVHAFTFEPEVVVHAAASYNDPDLWGRDVQTNALGTAKLVREAQRAGVGRLIYFQTALCYGTQPDEQPVTLNHPLRPDSSYAISKTAGEQYIAMSDVDYVSFRLANCYGPRNLSGPLPAFYKRITGDQPCTVMDTRRDFVYVDDLIGIVMQAVEGTGQGVYHVSSGSDVPISELYDELLFALMHVGTAHYEARSEGDAETILLDPSRTLEDFGRIPDTSLKAGVEAAVEWYREHGVGETYTHLKIAT